MVTIRCSIKSIITLAVLSCFALNNAQSALPTDENVNSVATEVRMNLEALEIETSRENFEFLKNSVLKFKDFILLSGQAVDYSQGGAATPMAGKFVRTITHFGVDIANAIFAFRMKHGSQLTQLGLEQSFEDLMVNDLAYPLVVRTSFKVYRHRVDERSADGHVSFWDVWRRTFAEIGRDLFSFFGGGRNRYTGEIFYTPMESAAREALARDLISAYRKYAEEHIPAFNKLFDGDHKYDRENHEERLGGLLLLLSDRAVNVRVERDSAQWYARLFYLASGIVLATPIFNYTNMPIIKSLFSSFSPDPHAYTAHLESSLITLSVFATIYLIKGATSSLRSTREWLAFSEQVRQEMAAGLVESTERFLKTEFKNEYAPAVVPRWIQREMGLRKALSSHWQKLRNSVQQFVPSCSRMLGS